MRKPKAKPEPVTKVQANNQLKSIIERVERLAEQRQEITDDINAVFAEAKGNGYDVKALKIILRERKMDAAKREELESIVDIYKQALGMLIGTPLGDSAVERAATH